MGRRLLLLVLAVLVPRASIAADEPLDERLLAFSKKYCVECHGPEEPRAQLDLTTFRTAADVTRDFRRWIRVVEFVRKGEMPPADEDRQPTLEERNAFAEAVEALLRVEADRHAGDPGHVPPRRLSRTEYDHAVRDLTGVDIRPTADFPTDPAGGEGFDNTGEALAMSPSLFAKYLDAASRVADHLVLRTDGLDFAPFPVTSYNERRKLTEQAIIDFYRTHDVRPGDYIEAAWRYRHRAPTFRGDDIRGWARRNDLSERYLALVWETLTEANAYDAQLGRLGRLWDAVPPPAGEDDRPRELQEVVRYVEHLRERLGYAREQLIRSNAGNWPIGHLDFRSKVAARRDRHDPSRVRTETFVRFDQFRVPKKPEDRRTVVLRLRIEPAFDDAGRGIVIVDRPELSRSGNRSKNDKDREKNEVVPLRTVLEKHAPDVARRLGFGRHPAGGEIDPDSFALRAPATIEIPFDADLMAANDRRQLLLDCRLDVEHSADAAVHVVFATDAEPDPLGPRATLLMDADGKLAKAYNESAARFCRAFPNRFSYVDDRRGLAAGFHLVEGFFRDDRPLVEKVLDDEQRRELDRLWAELDFVTNRTETLLRGFVWFERAERHVLQDERFDFLRAEDPRLVDATMLDRFERVYLEKMGVRLKEDAIATAEPNERFDVIHGFFADVRDGLARQRRMRDAAVRPALADLDDFVRRAYRREPTRAELDSLQALFASLREREGVEPALRGVVTAVLCSPEFLYRYEAAGPGREGVRPLDGDALASRLSFWLWSSIPDEPLRTAASTGELVDVDALVEQTRRMLRDERAEAFAREFLGQWLRYRDFREKNPVNPDAFNGYDDELRAAMLDEPTRLAAWLIAEDRPITELLDSDVTFVNARLAKHYGGEIERRYRERAAQSDGEWQRVDGLREAGRGGVIGTAVVLARNSAGERTSPVKRGFWVVHHLLGQHFPPPPADVPELPDSEKGAEKSIRELLAEHAANPRCAMCHRHFDGLGLALEGFDPIGRSRTRDLGGRTIDDVAPLPNGETASGLEGLIEYIGEHRRREFVRTFCRKFLGYALGRSVLLSDRSLLEEMETALATNEYRFSAAFETVVRSRQFRTRRTADGEALSKRER